MPSGRSEEEKVYLSQATRKITIFFAGDKVEKNIENKVNVTI